MNITKHQTGARGSTTPTRNKLIEMLKEFPEEKIAIIFNFTKRIMSDGDEYDNEALSLQELEMIQASEKEYEKGEYVWWGDVKRSSV
ncbi:MAG: hypothetical protein A4E53_00546 [Pelotomaculum sp. PtaB.Bin104]|nr:MAG: hypothetical protein A4E53_00546 [Pelotomaculum sp. PtaB.Bin104]